MTIRIEFDADDLLRAVDRAVARKLPRFGDDVARDAKASLVVRNRPSRPGETPSIWTGALARIEVAMDAGNGAVVIGVPPDPSRRGGGEVPAILEFGGTDIDGRTIAARPWLGPAFAKRLQDDQPAVWKDALR